MIYRVRETFITFLNQLELVLRREDVNLVLNSEKCHFMVGVDSYI